MGQGFVGGGPRLSEWVFPLVPPSYDASHPLLVRVPVRGARSVLGSAEIPAVLLGLDMMSKEDLPRLGSLVGNCFLYLHSNGCDIAQCADDLLTFRDGLFDGDAVVLCPEYPGYGLLRHFRPSVSGINAVARAAWEFCIHGLGFRPSQVMVGGRSIGTGPATQLAAALADEAQDRRTAFASGLSGLDSARACGRFEPASASAGASQAPRGPPWMGTASPKEADAGAGPPDGRGSLPVKAPPEPRRPAAGLDLFRCTKHELPQPNMFATVTAPFLSDSIGRSPLEPGETATVVRLDERGDTLLDFPSQERSQWVFTPNHESVAFWSCDRPSAGLALVAPLTGVDAVVRHHLRSDFLASLVGPMWDVLGMVRQAPMHHVPLLILHPKEDEIVPSSHGQALYEEATCRHKLGVWLCGARHNTPVDEEHLRIARIFFGNLRQAEPPAAAALAATPAAPRRVEALDGSPPDDRPARCGLDAACIADRLLDIGVGARADGMFTMYL